MFMEQSTLLTIGILSGILSGLSYVPYIIDTLQNRTQPQRASWLIWSVLCSIAFYSQIFEGAGPSLWFAGFQVLGCTTVFFLSIRHGAGEYLCKKNMVIFFASVMGLLALYITQTATYTLMITISVSMLGGIVTIQKAYHEPESETLSYWITSNMASVLAIFSIGELDWVLLAYPLYLITLYSMIIIACVLGKYKKSEVFARPISLPGRFDY